VRAAPLHRRPAPPTSRSGLLPLVEVVPRSLGEPLDPEIRAFMEPRFGHDFGQVRVHTDHSAAAMARALGARAYTVGRHVVFAAGQYRPRSKSGRRLLAHELTHVVQQGSSPAVQRQIEEERPEPEPTGPRKDAPSAGNGETSAVPDSLEAPPPAEHVSHDLAPEPDEETSAVPASADRSVAPAWANAIVPPDHPSEREAERVSAAIVAAPRPHVSARVSELAAAGVVHRRLYWENRSALTWADFTGAAPKGSPYDARTASGIEFPGFKPVQSEQPHPAGSPAPCTAGKTKTTEFEATVAINLAALNVRAYMEEKQSWVKKGKQDPALLAHEQGHFDIANAIAEKTEGVVKGWATANIAIATGCGKTAAMNAAMKQWNTLKAPAEVKKIYQCGRNLYDQAQKDYEDDTNHGLNTASQASWQGEIAKGLSKYTC
jgi:hypothetical protein